MSSSSVSTAPASSSTNIPVVWVPSLRITVPAGSCQHVVCPIAPVKDVCVYTPRYLRGMVAQAVAGGVCTDSEVSNITIVPGTLSGFETSVYPTICSFKDKECADKVCNLQYVSANAAKSGWECYSDPVVAASLSERKYWFANESESSPCTTSKASCKDVRNTRDYDYTSASHRVTAPLVVLALLALGASGVAL